MCSPPQIGLKAVPQAHRVVMSVEKLIDHERQLIAVMVCEGTAAWSGNRSKVGYQHDFSST